MDRRIPLPPIGAASSDGRAGAAAGADAGSGGGAHAGASGGDAGSGAHAGAPGAGSSDSGTSGLHAGEDTGHAPGPAPASPPPAAAAPPSSLNKADIANGQGFYDDLQKAPATNSIDHDYNNLIQDPAYERGADGKVPKVEVGPVASPDYDELNKVSGPMQDLKLDATDNTFRFATLQAKSKMGAISRTYASDRQKTIVISASYNNQYPKDFPKARMIPQSEIIFQQWKAESPNGVANLKFVVRKDVNNGDTQQVIKKANMDLNGGNLVKNAQQTFDFKAPVAPGAANPQKDGFLALAQTDNGRGVFRMLADHKADFQDLNVVKVHTWVLGDDDSAFGNFQMIWELGR